jgi:hypothetical protein
MSVVAQKRQEIERAAGSGLHDAAINAFIECLATSSGATLFDDLTVVFRRTKLQATLSASDLGEVTLCESGSWSHRTHVRHHSDVDFLALASGERPRTPAMALALVYDAIRNSDWEIQSVSLSPPVIQVTYMSGPQFEIAPAWLSGTVQGYDMYHIVGRDLFGYGLKKWIKSAPQAHIEYVDEQNARHAERVKPLIQLVKAWNYAAGAPILSFYLEMRVAEYAASVREIRYTHAFRKCLQHLFEVDLHPMKDPMGLVGQFAAVRSRRDRRKVVSVIASTLDKLDQADGEVCAPAQYWPAMVSVFGEDFPLLPDG